MGDWEALLHFPYGCLSNCKRAHYHICNQEQERDSHTTEELLKSEGAGEFTPQFLTPKLRRYEVTDNHQHQNNTDVADVLCVFGVN